jgi:hypothetical protein
VTSSRQSGGGITLDTGVERGKHVNKFEKIVSLASLGFVVGLSLNSMEGESNTTFIYYYTIRLHTMQGGC